jgi:ketosteroid isomerase-like protein
LLIPIDNATVKLAIWGLDMPRKLTFLLLSALAFTAVAQDKAASSAADKSMILALENAWNQAELHHDAGAADALLGDTFVSIDHHGLLQTRAQYIADLKDTAFNPLQISNTDTSIYVYGNTAIVTSAYRTKGTDNGKPFLHNGRFTDTWINLNGKWKCVADQETLISK